MLNFLIKKALAVGLSDFGTKMDTVAGEAGYQEKDYQVIVGTVIQTVLALLGVVFLVLTIYAGFLWMTAEGNEQQLEKAKKILTGSIIGLIIVLSSYAISYFVLNSLSTNVLQ